MGFTIYFMKLSSKNYVPNISLQITNKNYSTAITHLYRAEVGRQCIWRTRLDTSMNWAISVTSGLTALTLSQEHVPHYFFVFISIILTGFCLIEARKFRYYLNSTERVYLLEKYFFLKFTLLQKIWNGLKK